MKKTFYRLSGKPFGRAVRFALVSDLHSQDPKKLLSELARLSPDYILMAGDILEALDGSLDDLNEKAFSVFEGCANIAPTFYCTGNHEDGGVHSGSRRWQTLGGKERVYTEKNISRIRDSGVVTLFDSFVLRDGIAFGGLMSGLICKNGEPDLEFLKELSSVKAPKVLICHHPEYYERYLKCFDIDLIVSGHAHGGQWRIFGRGVYAPGQGLFPKYTSGVHDNRFVISKGLKKGIIPRFFNPTEIVIIDM